MCVAICYDVSYPFVFPYRSKILHLYILKLIVTILSNQDKKVLSIRVDEYGALARSSEFMAKYHNMNITVQNIGGDSSSLKDKSEIPNINWVISQGPLFLTKVTRSKFGVLPNQSTILLSCRTYNRFRGDVP